MNKEEILEKHTGHAVHLFMDRGALVAMQAYADQQTATLQQELDRLKNPWVKCSEMLPEISQTYIVDYTINGEHVEPSIAYFSYITKEWDFLSPYQGIEKFVAINWCELPEPPQQ